MVAQTYINYLYILNRRYANIILRTVFDKILNVFLTYIYKNHKHIIS